MQQWGSNPFDQDNALIRCASEDSPYDGHLGENAVPVFFLGVDGSRGEVMAYTASISAWVIAYALT